jgi:hypothetical protein
VHKCEGQVQAAAHAARVGADLAVRGLGQPDPFDQLVTAAAALGFRDPVQGGLQPHVLAPRQVRVKRDLLKRRADRLPHPRSFA